VVATIMLAGRRGVFKPDVVLRHAGRIVD
jgi:hypothetical protein